MSKEKDDVIRKILEEVEVFEATPDLEKLSRILVDIFLEQQQRIDTQKTIEVLSVQEIQNKITSAITKEIYTTVSFGRPEIKSCVYFPISMIRSGTVGISDHDAIQHFRETMKPILENTNWKLSDKVKYQLGVLETTITSYS